MSDRNALYNQIIGALIAWMGGAIAYASLDKLFVYMQTGHIALSATAKSPGSQGTEALIWVVLIMFFGVWLAASGLQAFFKKS